VVPRIRVALDNERKRAKVDKPQPIKERAYKYSVEVVQFLDSLPHDVTSQVIIKQLLRSATSVAANIIEAQAASSRKEFASFYQYALKSTNESLYWLELLRDAKKVSSEKLKYLLEETRQLGKILGSSVVKLKCSV
jgi:four helix bundle protein